MTANANLSPNVSQSELELKKVSKPTKVITPNKVYTAVSDEHMIIRGGRPLEGTVQISGAKNAVLKMMAAALLTKDVCVLKKRSGPN